MDTQDKVSILSVICTRDEAGRHFSHVYSAKSLADLEEEGLIKISRPIHEVTWIAYREERWSVAVTDDGQALVNAYPEYCPVAQRGTSQPRLEKVSTRKQFYGINLTAVLVG